MIQDWIDGYKRLAGESGADAPLWGKVMLIVLFGLFGLLLCYIVHFLIKQHIIEYGYGKIKHRRRRFHNLTIVDEILLLSIYKEAPRRGAYLAFCQILNCIALFGAAVETFAIVSCIVTDFRGWAVLLMADSGFGTLVLYVLLDFIPSYICLPSVREHYKR